MSTVTVLVLLFGYHTSSGGPAASAATGAAPLGSATIAAAPVPGAASRQGSGGPVDTSAAAGAAGRGGSTPSPSNAAPRTLTGAVAGTRWGPVQVAVTITDGRITDVQVLQHPDANGHDQQVNARAVPVLVQETLNAQSADIDMVSGATITSTGYRQSLQSALDQAHG